MNYKKYIVLSIVFWVWTNNNSFTIKIPSVIVFCIIIIKLEKKIKLALFINTIYNDFSFSSDKKFGKNKTTHVSTFM